MKPANKAAQKLCMDLVHADSERQVISLLEAAGYWDDPTLWRWLGDEEFNYPSVGNQQSRAEQAIIEKLINSIDAKLIAAARVAGCLPTTGSIPQAVDTPQSINEARDRFFKAEIKNLEQLSRSITVSATGAKPKGRPCFTIVDDGEGQTPTLMPLTILSLHKGNKDKIKFVQGKFNMGGTGVLEFCGIERNVQLVLSRRHPSLLPNPPQDASDSDWSFTIIRREDPSEGKSSRFSYLAPVGVAAPREGKLLHFAADELPMLPEKNKAYLRAAKWGTLIKLYEYDARRFATNMMIDDGLMYRARLLLPQPALPIRFHECREYKGDPNRSFDTTMVGLIETLHRDLEDAKRDNVEWSDKLQFDVDGERFTVRIYLFKNKDAADRYRRDEGLVFTYNGQCHAVMTKDFFRRKSVKLDYLWHSLLAFVDCSDIGTRTHEKLFMNSRDRLRDTDLKEKLESELADQLANHEILKQIASERRKKELAEQPQATETMAKAIENLLSKNPTLAALLGPGFRVKNPHKPESVGLGVVGFIGKRFPTKFYFKGHEEGYHLTRDAHLNSRARITFETDAANDYFSRDSEPGDFSLFVVNGDEREPATNYQRPRMANGYAHISLSLPDSAKEGDQLAYEAVINDPSRVEPFRNAFTLKVRAEQTSQPGAAGKQKNQGNASGAGKGPTDKGNEQTNDSSLDAPSPIPVYEADWAKHDPPFDKFTAMRIRQQPHGPNGEERYDYYVNMDNVYLQSNLKDRPKLAPGMNLRYSVGMTLIALSVLHQEQMRKKSIKPSEDLPDGKVAVQERVAQTTSAIAPFLLPMIEGVSELDPPEENLSDSAGEAA